MQQGELIQAFEQVMGDLLAAPLLQEMIYRDVAEKKAAAFKPADTPQLDDTPSQRDFGLSDDEKIQHHAESVARYEAMKEGFYKHLKKYDMQQAADALRPVFHLFDAWGIKAINDIDDLQDALQTQLRQYCTLHQIDDHFQTGLINGVKDYVVETIKLRAQKP